MPLFGWSSATKKSPKIPGNTFSNALLMSRFHYFGWSPWENPAFETALCTVSVDELMNESPNQFGAKHPEKLFSSLVMSLFVNKTSHSPFPGQFSFINDLRDRRCI